MFDINELTARTLLKETNRIEDKEIDVEVDFEEDVYGVYADAERIVQVLTNLIDNAIKYVDGNKRIRISTSEKKGKIRVAVENTGRIAEEDIKRIFDRFYIADKARSPGAGTGIGLSIAQRIILEHEEEISAENTNEGYVRFCFTLPKAKKEELRNRNGGMINEQN